MNYIRLNIGVDISKDKFDVNLTLLTSNGSIENIQHKTFDNTIKGIKSFYKWCRKFKKYGLDFHFTMEATGVYYETLAFFLKEQGEIIHVLVPNHAKKYFASLGNKSKTDKIDAMALGRMGAERELGQWELGSPIYREMKALIRERDYLVSVRTRFRNRKHAEISSGNPHKSIINRTKSLVENLTAQINQIQKELEALVNTDKSIKKKIKKIMTIPGIGFIVATTVIAETLGFVNISSIRQLVSYSGLDPVTRESGTWKGRSRISKQGNSHIRKVLYMAAMVNTRENKKGNNLHKFYKRIKDRKGNGLIAIVALERKILGLIYSLWRDDTEYIDNFEEIRESKKIISGNDEQKILLLA